MHDGRVSWFTPVRLATCFAVALCLVISPYHAAPAAAEGWVRDWLICGPFQTAGFSMVAPFFETALEPNAWEVYRDEWAPDRGWEVTWRPYQSPTDDIDFDLDETFAGRPAMDWPPRWPPSAYAHLYITAPQRDVLLDFHATGPARIWLNGQDVAEIQTLPSGVPAEAGYTPSPSDGPYRGPITLLNGVNRLLIKLNFPQKDYGTGLGRPTRFRLRLLDVDGSPIGGLRYDLNNPRLYPPDLALRSSETSPEPGSCLADLTEIGITSDRPRHVFYSDQPVKLSAQVRLLNSEERTERFERDDTRYDAETFAGRLSANLVSYYGDVAGREATDIEYGLEPGETDWDFGAPPKGHYTLYCRLHLGGQLLKMPLPTMISVVDRPHPLPEGVTSKFGHSYYYLGSAEPEFVEVLAAGGVRLNIGSNHWWWLSDDPREWIKKPVAEREWAYTPKEEVLAEAGKWGVELTGDLGGCWPAEYRKMYYSWWEIPDETKGKLVVINPYFPTYTYDSPEFVKMVREYVISAVNKFKPHFRYWKQQNEVNQVRYGMTPEMWGHIIKATYEAAKEADPDCIIVNASMTGLGLNFLEPLFQQGYDKYFDVIDYHQYAWPFYDPADDLSGLKRLLALLDKYGVDKPLWNGEFGAYRSLWEDGARAQAGAWARHMVCAHTYDRLALVGAHFHSGNGWGATSGDRGQFPAYVAYRTCADNLEGATDHEQLSLGPQIAAYRFNQASGRVTVVWTRDGM